MKKKDRIEGLIWMILAVSVCIGSFKLDLGTFQKPGPGFMPFLAGSVLGLFSLILILSTFLDQFNREDTRAIKFFSKKKWKNFVLPLLSLFGYVLLLDVLGFIFTTFLFLLFLFKITDPRRWFWPLVLTGSTVSISYLVFSLWLKCQFPKGIITKLLR